jgi:excinuclease ABC subunit C
MTDAAPRTLAGRLPLGPGVYRFRDANGRVLYLGRAVSLRRRVASYWGDLRDRRHLSAMVARITRVEAVACDSAHEAAWLERNLLEARLPPWNRAPSGGQEVEVWMRVSGTERNPGITVVHQPAGAASREARDFGPYLGGRQVRLAVSGLSRVHPLGYAADDARGSQRDFARVLGVSAAERAALAAAVAAVLDRDPDAVETVRASLAARRDAAAGTLAFEFAGRLQEEIEALDWITGEQKVTRSAAVDCDVHGWADGMLVSFAMRGGRVTGWTQRACGAAAARERLAATPPEWSAFAQRNAELAARLVSRDLRSPLPLSVCSAADHIVVSCSLSGLPSWRSWCSSSR